MIDDLRAVAVFAETIKQGSFRAAAKTLNLSPSVVSYHVGQLEQRVGSALIYRSTRKLSLTHEGELLYKHAQDMLNSARQGIEEVTSANSEASGRLCITIPSALTRSHINQSIAEFCLLHPCIELKISYTDARQDLISQGIDLALRAGDIESSTLKCKRIGEIERKLVCSAKYAQSKARIKHPADLEDWNWIRLTMMPGIRQLYSVKAGRSKHKVKKGEKYEVKFNGNIVVDNVEAMTQMCLYGVGAATPPSFLVEDGLRSGELVEPLPDWKVEPIPLYALWPGNVTINSNTRRLLDYLSNNPGASS